MAAGPPSWAYTGELEGHSDHVQCLCAHPYRAGLLASGGKDSSVILWDIDRGEGLRKHPLHEVPLWIIFGQGEASTDLIVAHDSNSPRSPGKVPF